MRCFITSVVTLTGQRHQELPGLNPPNGMNTRSIAKPPDYIWT